MNAIYKMKNLITGDFYIGSSTTYDYRRWMHIHLCRKQKHHNAVIQEAWNTYGEGAFVFGIVEEVKDTKNLLEREQFYLDTLLPKYNRCKLAVSPLGIKHTDKSRLNIRNAHLGKKLSPESIAKRTATVLGTKRSESIKENMRIGAKNQSLITIQLDLNGNFIKEWRSVNEAARTLGFSQAHISSCCRKCYGRKTHKGFKWKYKD